MPSSLQGSLDNGLNEVLLAVLPRYPKDVGLERDGPSPWLKLFQNAREWCTASKSPR